MIVKLLTEQKGGCRGSSESTHVKMSHCLKSHALALIVFCFPYSMRTKSVYLATGPTKGH